MHGVSFTRNKSLTQSRKQKGRLEFGTRVQGRGPSCTHRGLEQRHKELNCFEFCKGLDVEWIYTALPDGARGTLKQIAGHTTREKKTTEKEKEAR